MAQPEPGGLGTLAHERAAVPPELAQRFWSESLERFEEAATGRRVDRDLVVAGVPVRISFAGPAMYEAMFPAFDHLARHTGPDPARRILIWDTASTGVGRPDPVWSTEDFGPLSEILSLPGPVHVIADASRLLTYNSESGTLICTVPDAALLPWHEHAAPVRSGLHWVLTGPERHFIHGAAVGEGSGGLLIAAPSGSGKSTLAVACFQAGLDVAADDFVIVTLAGAPRAHSIYATAKLDRGSLDLVAPDPDMITNPDFVDPEKAVLDLRSGPLVRELPLSAIVIPQPTGTSSPRLERIGRPEALRYLGPSSVVVMPTPRGAAFATAGALARSLPAWRLELGDDLPAAVACLRGLLGAEEAA